MPKPSEEWHMLAIVIQMFDIVKYLAGRPAVPGHSELLQGETLQRRVARARIADDRHFDASGGVHRCHP
jgi:hypothetical protein